MSLEAAFASAADLLGMVVLLLLAYILLFKSALLLLWGPLLRPLGFRVVCMDRSYHIYALRWRPAWGDR